MLCEHWFVRGEVRLNYAEGPPSGPPMVLLHGGGSRGWESFLSVVPGLLGRYHLYALDLRGHGKSGWTPGSYTLADFAGDIVAFLEEQVGKPAILFGHSLGGTIALLAAVECPGLISAVIVGDTPFSNDSLRARIVATGEEALRRNAARERPHDPDFHYALQERFGETCGAWDRATLLPAVESPVLILQADPSCGGVLTDDEVHDALALLRKGCHCQFPGLDHGLGDGAPEPVLDAVERFLSSHGLAGEAEVRGEQEP